MNSDTDSDSMTAINFSDCSEPESFIDFSECSDAVSLISFSDCSEATTYTVIQTVYTCDGDWWHVVCMWGEPCSVLIVLIFLCVRACVCAQQLTIDEVVTPLAAGSSNCIGTKIDISVHCDGHFICTFYSHQQTQLIPVLHLAVAVS